MWYVVKIHSTRESYLNTESKAFSSDPLLLLLEHITWQITYTVHTHKMKWKKEIK